MEEERHWRRIVPLHPCWQRALESPPLPLGHAAPPSGLTGHEDEGGADALLHGVGRLHRQLQADRVRPHAKEPEEGARDGDNGGLLGHEEHLQAEGTKGHTGQVRSHKMNCDLSTFLTFVAPQTD